MNTLKRLFVTALVIPGTCLCYAHKNTQATDSAGTAVKEEVRVAKRDIGDADYHQKFGKVIIEKAGDKYHITFPFFLYTTLPNEPGNPEDDLLPRGTQIIIKLDNGKEIKSKTDQDTKALWHYLWHYYQVTWFANHHKIVDSECRIYRSRNRITTGSSLINNPEIEPWVGDNDDLTNSADAFYAVYPSTADDLYGLNWLVTFEFSRADMLRMGKHRIIDAYITKGDKKISLPVKKKQSKRVKKSIEKLVRG